MSYLRYPDLLLIHHLKYELRVRQLGEDGDAHHLRTELRAAVDLGISPNPTVIRSFDPEQELIEVQGDVIRLSGEISNFEFSLLSNHERDIIAQLEHNIARLNNLNCLSLSGDIADRCQGQLQSTQNILFDFNSKIEEFRTAAAAAASTLVSSVDSSVATSIVSSVPPASFIASPGLSHTVTCTPPTPISSMAMPVTGAAPSFGFSQLRPRATSLTTIASFRPRSSSTFSFAPPKFTPPPPVSSSLLVSPIASQAIQAPVMSTQAFGSRFQTLGNYALSNTAQVSGLPPVSSAQLFPPITPTQQLPNHLSIPSTSLPPPVSSAPLFSSILPQQQSAPSANLFSPVIPYQPAHSAPLFSSMAPQQPPANSAFASMPLVDYAPDASYPHIFSENPLYQTDPPASWNLPSRMQSTWTRNSKVYGKMRNPMDNLLKTLKETDGLNSEKLVEFLSQVLQIQDKTGCKDSDLLEGILAYTSPPLSQCITSTLSSNGSFDYFHQLALGLLPPCVGRHLKTHLVDRFQKDSETFNAFVHDIYLKARVMRDARPEKVLVDIIVSNIHPTTSCHFVFQERPSTFADLIKLSLVAQDRTFADSQRKVQQTATPTTSSPSTSSAPNKGMRPFVNAVNPPVSTTFPPNTATPPPPVVPVSDKPQGAKKDYNCYTCGTKGHISRFCPNRAAPKN